MQIARTLKDYPLRRRLRSLACEAGGKSIYFMVVEPGTLLVSGDSYNTITAAISQAMKSRSRKRSLQASGITVLGRLQRGKLNSLHNDLIMLQMGHLHGRVRSGRIWADMRHPTKGTMHAISLWMMAQSADPLPTVYLVLETLGLDTNAAIYWETFDCMKPQKLRSSRRSNF